MVSFDVQTTEIIDTREGRDPAFVLLWPVYLWRVIVPNPSAQRSLNLFQRLILGCCSGGLTDLEKLCERLCLQEPLVEIVLEELKGYRYLSDELLVTKAGRDALVDLYEETQAQQSGVLLQSAYSGDLLPSFAQESAFTIAEVEWNDKNKPVILLGSRGDPWRTKPFECQDLVAKPPLPPTPELILKTFERALGKKRWRTKQKACSLLNQEPVCRFLALKISAMEGELVVYDPFTKEPSAHLKKELFHYLETRSASANKLKNRLIKITDLNRTLDSLSALANEAKKNIELHFTHEIVEFPSLYRRLLAFEQAKLEATQAEAPRDKLDDALIKGQKVVEHVLGMILMAAPDEHNSYHRILSQDKHSNAELLKRIAERLGFTPPKVSSLRVQPGKIAHTEHTGIGSLKARLALVLLQSQTLREPPLKVTAQEHPHLIQDLLVLAERRDQAAHDTDDHIGDHTDDHTDDHTGAVRYSADPNAHQGEDVRDVYILNCVYEAAQSLILDVPNAQSIFGAN